MKSNKTSKIIEELSQQWIGKYGVLGVFEELHGSDIIIKFLVQDLKNNFKQLPNHYKNYNIEFEGIDTIMPHKR